MSKEILIISDIHGCHKTLLALLEKAKWDNSIPLYFLGDMVDRGPDSKSVIGFAMRHRVNCVIGNHEHMMLDFYGKIDRTYDFGVWQANGGLKCIMSFGKAVPDYIIEWVSKLPLWIVPEEHPNLLLSHTGHFFSERSNQNDLTSLWARIWLFPDDKYFRVFGHTQHKDPMITDKYAMIDTGCAYKSRGFGKLTALKYPSMEIIQHECID